MKKANRMPKSALALYVQLYIRRKRKNQNPYVVSNLLVDATKSWIKLSESEKLKIQELYREFVVNYKNKFAEYLKEAKPFMKTKVIRDTSCDKEKNITESQELPIQTMYSHQRTSLIQEDEVVNHSYVNEMPEPDNSDDVGISDHKEYSKEQLIEPVPPTVKFAKDLFELIKNKNEENHLSWSSLSQIEKRRYQRTVLLLKKDYIKNYAVYLMQLKSEELFQVYVDNV